MLGRARNINFPGPECWYERTNVLKNVVSNIYEYLGLFAIIHAGLNNVRPVCCKISQWHINCVSCIQSSKHLKPLLSHQCKGILQQLSHAMKGQTLCSKSCYTDTFIGVIFCPRLHNCEVHGVFFASSLYSRTADLSESGLLERTVLPTTALPPVTQARVRTSVPV